jgi:hypothetical protein
MINYDNRIFRAVSNTANGETGMETLFHYQQEEGLVSATYSGGSIIFGHLIALVNEEGELDMHYHHLNDAGELRTGICHSIPQVLESGKIRLIEKWKWTNGDQSEGESIVEEI